MDGRQGAAIKKNGERDRGMKESKVEGNEASRRFERDRGVRVMIEKEGRGSPRETREKLLRERGAEGYQRKTASVPRACAGFMMIY